MNNTVISSKKKTFKVGKDTYQLKVELSKKRTISKSSTKFLIDGQKYTINWSYNYVEGPGASWNW